MGVAEHTTYYQHIAEKKYVKSNTSDKLKIMITEMTRATHNIKIE